MSCDVNIADPPSPKNGNSDMDDRSSSDSQTSHSGRRAFDPSIHSFDPSDSHPSKNNDEFFASWHSEPLILPSQHSKLFSQDDICSYPSKSLPISPEFPRISRKLTNTVNSRRCMRTVINPYLMGEERLDGSLLDSSDSADISDMDENFDYCDFEAPPIYHDPLPFELSTGTTTSSETRSPYQSVYSSMDDLRRSSEYETSDSRNEFYDTNEDFDTSYLEANEVTKDNDNDYCNAFDRRLQNLAERLILKTETNSTMLKTETNSMPISRTHSLEDLKKSSIFLRNFERRNSDFARKTFSVVIDFCDSDNEVDNCEFTINNNESYSSFIEESNSSTEECDSPIKPSFKSSDRPLMIGTTGAAKVTSIDITEVKLPSMDKTEVELTNLNSSEVQITSLNFTAYEVQDPSKQLFKSILSENPLESSLEDSGDKIETMSETDQSVDSMQMNLNIMDNINGDMLINSDTEDNYIETMKSDTDKADEVISSNNVLENTKLVICDYPRESDLSGPNVIFPDSYHETFLENPTKQLFRTILAENDQELTESSLDDDSNDRRLYDDNTDVKRGSVQIKILKKSPSLENLETLVVKTLRKSPSMETLGRREDRNASPRILSQLAKRLNLSPRFPPRKIQLLRSPEVHRRPLIIAGKMNEWKSVESLNYSESLYRQKSMESLYTSRETLWNEDECINGLFYACDQEDSGVVRVSDLVAYLQNTTGQRADGDQESRDEDFDELTHLLDPFDDNPWITLESCSDALRQWIKLLREKSYNDSIDDDNLSSTSCSLISLNGNDTSLDEQYHNSLDSSAKNTSLDVFQSASLDVFHTARKPTDNVTYRDRRLGKIPIYDGTEAHCEIVNISLLNKETTGLVNGGPISMTGNHSFGSLEASGGDSMPHENEPTELQNRLAECQHRNKILQEENGKLQNQLDNYEDDKAVWQEEADFLHKKLWALQEVRERNQNLLQEIEDIKVENAAKDEMLKSHQHKVRDFEKETLNLTEDFDEMKNKHQRATEECTEIKTQLLITQSLLVEEQERLNDVNLLEDQLMNKSLVRRASRIDDLESQNQQLLENVELLKKEKNDLECHNSQLQQQLVKEVLNTKSVEIASDDEDSECSLPVSSDSACINNNAFHSTPLSNSLLRKSSRKGSQQSLHSELQNALLDSEDDYQSPLCEKSYGDVESLSIHEMTASFTEGDNDLYIIMKKTIMEKQNDVTSKLIREFTKTRNSIQKEMDHVQESVKNHVMLQRPALKMKGKFEKCMARFADNLSKLHIANDNVERMVVAFLSVMRRLKDEKDDIRSELNTAFAQVADHETHPTLLVYIVYMKSWTAELEQKIESLDFDLGILRCENEELSDTVDGLILRREHCERDIHTLNGTNLELVEKLKDAEGSVGDIKDELACSRELLLQEQKKSQVLEETLVNALSASQVKDIYKLLQKDLDIESCMLIDEKGTSTTVSADSVKDQVAREISILKSQLHRSLRALSTTARGISQDSDSQQNNNDGQASPLLLDTLLLDRLESILGRSVDNQHFIDILNLPQDTDDTCPLLTPNNISPNLHHSRGGPCSGLTVSGVPCTDHQHPVAGECRYSGPVTCFMNLEPKPCLGKDGSEVLNANSSSVQGIHRENSGITRERNSSFKNALESASSNSLLVENQDYMNKNTIINARTMLDTNCSLTNQSSTDSEIVANIGGARDLFITRDCSPVRDALSSRFSPMRESSLERDSRSPPPPDYRAPPQYQRSPHVVSRRDSLSKLTKQQHISPGNTPRNLSPETIVPPHQFSYQAQNSLLPVFPPLQNSSKSTSVTFKLDSLSVHSDPKTTKTFRVSPNLSLRNSASNNTATTTTTRTLHPGNLLHQNRSSSSESEPKTSSPNTVRFKLEKAASDETQNSSVQTSPNLMRRGPPPGYHHSVPNLKVDSPPYEEPELTECDLPYNQRVHSLRQRLTAESRSVSREDSQVSEESQDEASSYLNPEKKRHRSALRSKSLTESQQQDSDSDVEQKRGILKPGGIGDGPPDHRPPPPYKPPSNGQLTRIRQEHMKRRGGAAKHPLPELMESSETESLKGSRNSIDSEHHGEHVIVQSGNAVFPSLTESFLKKLGVSKSDCVRTDELSDIELEEKFAALALAFKTDQQTLIQRVGLQERARDMAEQNVDKELDTLRNTIKDLGQFCSDPALSQVLSKLAHHVDILEQTTARVSSRAELHGAVQQEGRMSHAIEVMVAHVECLRQVYEKEHIELEESRKILHDNRILPTGGDMDGVTRRSISMANAASKVINSKMSHRSSSSSSSSSNHPPVYHHHRDNHRDHHNAPSQPSLNLPGKNDDEPGKRRASTSSYPRLFSSSQSTNLESGPRPVLLAPSYHQTSSPSSNQDSLEKDKSGTSSDGNNRSEMSSKKERLSETSEEKEEIFQKGFEQGVRISVSHELCELREQQTAFCDTLEDLMDKNQGPDDENDDSESDLLDQLWEYVPHWDGSWRKLRLVLALLVLGMAIMSVYFALTLAPMVVSGVDGGQLPEASGPWFLNVRRSSGPVPF